jgi:predicted RNA-binding protein with PUA-like domain
MANEVRWREMPYYLLKTEPDAYSFDNLQHDRETIWDGVSNPAAVRNLLAMKAGDQLIIYHTGDVRTAVGTATVVSVHADGKTPLVKIHAGKPLQTPRTLAEIKGHQAFAESPLVRQGRLSVVPLTQPQYQWIVGE